MVKKKTAGNILEWLNREPVETWFDLGLFIDRFREERITSSTCFKGNYEAFAEYLKSGGIAFVTFSFSVDGVSIEIEKYASVFRRLFPGINIHYIAGHFRPESYKMIHPSIRKKTVAEAVGFDSWPLYRDYFFRKLERGSDLYNELIGKMWKEVKAIAVQLADYAEKKKVTLFFPVNVCSNPGNVSLAIALVLVSEYLNIPVINNAHDYYWEGGTRPEDIKRYHLRKGPRDFFFTNAHLGEVFSPIEVFYPWESRRWITLNINRRQSDHVIRINGHNPANVMEIGTAVDMDQYTTTNKRIKINTFYQFEQVLSRYRQILVSYSVDDALSNKLVEESDPRPILINGYQTRPLKNFLAENIIFLQPTRIISRKKIEVSFRLIRKLFQSKEFTGKFSETENLKLTLLVTGPIASGHFGYFVKLLQQFARLVNELPELYRQKIYLAFLFSELDKEHFKRRFEKPVGIPELYNIASLVLLPSETEGRGLPIIEAAACGVPIFCRKYEPQNVYEEVIGLHLPEKDRLQVIEFDGLNITRTHVKKILNRVFFPHLFQTEVLHNQMAVRKRYSLPSLEKSMEGICRRLHHQLQDRGETSNFTGTQIQRYRQKILFRNDTLRQIIKETHRQYLPGFGKMGFMIFLKSLIDPSYFRVEEQYLRGTAMQFAREMMLDEQKKIKIPEEKIISFYNAVDEIFRYCEGDYKIMHDHSFAYRHRARKHYAWHDFTLQEISGLINMMFVEIVQPDKTTRVLETSQFFTDWNLALSQLTASSCIAIDDRKWLFERMKANVPMVIFAGRYVSHELEFFALQSIRSRMKLDLQEELTREILEESASAIAPVYVFAQKYTVRNWPEVNEIEKFIKSGRSGELKLLYDYKLLRIIPVEQWCVGIHLPQLGEKAIAILKEIRDQNGLIITHRKDSVIMSDIMDIDRVHIGKVEDPLTEGFMGIPMGSGFIIHIPAGLRVCLSYPVPVQTARQFHEALHGETFRKMCERYGTTNVMEELKKDAENNGSPVAHVLKKMAAGTAVRNKMIEYQYVSGLYEDGMPWNGVLARLKTGNPERKWKFIVLNADSSPQKVTRFVREFELQTGRKALVAWNGGYILNAELVGKLGLPESYIGSPLGMIITGGKILSAPLFSKPAFLVDRAGNMTIQRISLSQGITLFDEQEEIHMTGEQRNPAQVPADRPCFYDLMYSGGDIPARGRSVVRMAGDRIMEVIRKPVGGRVKIIPVGITLSFPEGKVPEGWMREGKVLQIHIPGFENIQDAIEAGPLLVKNGKKTIDMEVEGWKTAFSIATQAARLDYTDMRGPKIAAGTDKKGNLLLLAVNGRIRESVGATHEDMADIMIRYGAHDAMGFDPGGSSTLVVEGKTLNISPYNSRYQENVFSLPPEPRAVSNAVIGYLE
ncbi:MAG TPA: glycosyltransferase [Bacteroidetes bacterium]|nr:glycosyltransferase [Bacteroidota bacterium]